MHEKENGSNFLFLIKQIRVILYTYLSLTLCFFRSLLLRNPFITSSVDYSSYGVRSFAYLYKRSKHFFFKEIAKRKRNGKKEDFYSIFSVF